MKDIEGQATQALRSLLEQVPAPENPAVNPTESKPECEADREADILAALRAATAARHDVIDQAMPLSKATPTLSDYRQHLCLLHAWLAPLETWMADFSDGPQDARWFAQLRRLPLLERDLADPATPPGRCGAPLAPIPTLREEPAYRWGVAYVIEGSQLGGTVLYRKLAQSLAPHPLRYLNGDGSPPGPRWQQFLRALRHEVQGEQAITLACQGAQDAFDGLLSLVDKQAGPDVG